MLLKTKIFGLVFLAPLLTNCYVWLTLLNKLSMDASLIN